MALLDFSAFADPAAAPDAAAAPTKPAVVTKGGVDFSKFGEAAPTPVPKPPPRPVTSGGVDFSSQGEPVSMDQNPMASRAPGGENRHVPGVDPEHPTFPSRLVSAAVAGASPDEPLAKDYWQNATKALQNSNSPLGSPEYALRAAVFTAGGVLPTAWDAFGRAIGAGGSALAEAGASLVQAADDTFGKPAYSRLGDPEAARSEVLNLVNYVLISAGMPEIYKPAVRPDLGVRPEVRDFLKTAAETPAPLTKAQLRAKGVNEQFRKTMEALAPERLALPPPGGEAAPTATAATATQPPETAVPPEAKPAAPPPTIAMPPRGPEQVTPRPEIVPETPPKISGVSSLTPQAIAPPTQLPAPKSPDISHEIKLSQEGVAPAAPPPVINLPGPTPAKETPSEAPLPPPAQPARPVPQPAEQAPAVAGQPAPAPSAAPGKPLAGQGQDGGAAVHGNNGGVAGGGGRTDVAAAPPVGLAGAHWHGNEEVAALEPARVQQEMARPEVQAALAKPVKIDRSYDIPYLAGYSTDGSTVFIDRHLPRFIDVNGRQVDTNRLADDHEIPEKALIDVLRYKYQFAHEIASGHEDARLRADGIDPVAYNKVLAPYIKHDQHEQLTRVPPNLDMSPYNDTQAKNIEARMAKAGVTTPPDGVTTPVEKPQISAETAAPSVTTLAAPVTTPPAPALRDISPEKKMATEMGRPYTDWIAKIEDVDAHGEPDAAYRKILSTGSKETRSDGRPKGAPSWREKVLGLIRDAHGKQPAEKSVWTKLDKNEAGRMLFQDQRGVRSYVSNGVRHTEPVAVRPDGSISLRADRGEWTLASEKATASGVTAPPGYTVEGAQATRPPEDAQRKGGRFTAIARRLNPFSVEAGYADTAEDAQRDALRRVGAPGFAAEKPAEPPPPAEAPTPAPKPEAAPAEKPAAGGDPGVELARAITDRLLRHPSDKLVMKDMLADAVRIHGGTLAEGKFDRKDVYDAMELAVNIIVREHPKFRVDNGDWEEANRKLTRVLDQLPTQTVRSEEQVSFQQFSTPPNYAAAVAYAAGLRGTDVVMEPSAGTGSILAASMRPGVTLIANELSPRRVALLKELVGDRGRVFQENAEQIDNILPESVKPTVVVMNPPFSQTAGRMGDKKDLLVGANHIEQALKRLEPGGRLVAIVAGGTGAGPRQGVGMSLDAPRYKPWWDKIRAQYDVKANIPVEGSLYAKYGTSFGTRLLVIDKVPPSGVAPVTTTASTIPDLFKALEGIRDARPAGKQPAGQSSGVAVAENRPAEPRPVAPVPSEPGAVGARPGSAGGVPAAGPPGAGEPSPPPVRVEPGERPGVAPVEPERPVAEGAGEGTPPVAPPRDEPASGGEPSPQPDLQPAAGGEPRAPAGGERASLETVAPGQQSTAAITDDLYEPYKPQRVQVRGAQPHPGPLVQSAAMASVDPPVPTYNPAIPSDVIKEGELSLAQLETIIYAGQSHQRMLPTAEGEVPVRRGFFIGDGTGVGKGREIAGIMLDQWEKGSTKHVWVSEKKGLIEDARRDWSGVKQNPNHIFDIGKTKAGEPVSAKQGIAFVTYDTLKGGMSDQAALAKGGLIRKQAVTVNGRSGTVQSVTKGKEPQAKIKFDNGDVVSVPAGEAKPVEGGGGVKTRVDQLADWLGPNFDGVIAFDEAHNMGNAITVKGDRGMQEAAQKALAGVALQQRLPNARVVYVSATGATEVSNLAYADRLGLWGRGTPFADRNKFISDIESGGIAAMELVARDMKQLGLYTARNLSYDGVEYTRLEHKLDPAQREIYDQLAEAWQVVLRNIEKALELTGGDKSRAAKNAAKSAFWSSHQRFFNQIITSLQMPSVVKGVEKDLAEGRQAVLQLTNTNEASQERAAAKAQSAEDIEDLDITPRDMVIQLVEKSFPTQQYESYVDDDGNERTRPVTDAEGKPVENREAVAIREAMIEKLASIRVPQGPLDMILDHFGVDNVAEVTGRGRRFVMKPDPQTGRIRRVEEPRPASANLGETQAFQSGKKRILVFSEAGGTGRSYHADNTSPSKDARRSHYLVQAGWRADKAVQGFGRTHRTNQASAPIFTLVTTDLQGQKRFISSIARRLSQLGALTKGQRQAGDQGIFSARDNLESHEAQVALQHFYTDLLGGRVEGVDIEDFENQTGLQLRQKDEEGGVIGVKQNLPPITQFLNRLLSMKIGMQNRVFDAFAKSLDDVIEARRQAGLLDLGLETIKADKITKNSERTVHTDPETGAETDHVKLTLADRFRPRDFPKAEVGFAVSPKGKVYSVENAPTHTDARTGELTDQFRLRSPVAGARSVPRQSLNEKNGWQRVEESEARGLWKEETAKAPEFIERDLHLITGAILPIWDRLKGSTRVVRLQTDAGERYIGRVVPDSQVAATLEALGAKGEAQTVTPTKLFDSLMSGGSATLSNGWRLKRSLVAGEDRIELVGPASFGEGEEVKKDGVFTERIQYATRYFVPTGEDGPAVLERLTKFRPVTRTSEGRGLGEDQALGSTAVGKRTPSEAPPVKVPPEARASLEQSLRNKVAQLIGAERAKAISFEPIISAESGGDTAYNAAMDRYAKLGGKIGDTAGGSVRIMPSGEALIRLATDDPKFSPMGSARHEPMHVAQAFLMTDEEVAALSTPEATKAIAGLASEELGAAGRGEKLPPYEALAIGYEHYDRMRDEGLSPAEIVKGVGGGIRGTLIRVFERLRNLLADIRQALTGSRGAWGRWQDVMQDFSEGKMADRPARQPVRDLTRGGDMRLGATAEKDAPRENFATLLNAAARGEETPPLTRAQARERKRAEKEFPYKQRIALDKTSRQLAARAEEVAQMADKFAAALKGAGLDTNAKKMALHQAITRYHENIANPRSQYSLTPGQLNLYEDHYKPLFDLHGQIYADMQALKHLMSNEQRDEFEAMLNPAYVHHVVIGKGGKYDKIARETGFGPILGNKGGGRPGGKSLPINAAAAKASTFYALENDRTGERFIVSHKPGEGLTKWVNGEPESAKGGFPASAELNLGKSFKTKGGDTFTVRRARLEEKMEHAPTDYHQNIYAITADSILALEHAKLGLQYFNDLTKTPEWLQYATKAGNSEPPEGWNRIDRAPLVGWYLAPELYEPLKDFFGGEPILNLAGTPQTRGLLGRIFGGLGKTLEGLNRLATQSIFISAIPHIWNVVNHAIIERGWDWMSLTGYGRLAVTGAQAWKIVRERGPLYQQLLHDGAPLFYSNARNNNLSRHIFDRTGAEIESDKTGLWDRTAKTFGFAGRMTMIPFIYREMSLAMWYAGDVIMVQRILELEMKNPVLRSRFREPMDRLQSISRARQHIPDYVVPPRVAGSRYLSRVLQDMNLTMFGRYRYSQWKSLSHDVSQTLDPRATLAERGAAIGRLLVTYIMATAIYSALDEYLQEILGIPKAQIVRGGPFHIIENLERLHEQGISGVPRFVFTTLIPAPIIVAAGTLALNHELWKEAFGFRDKPILNKDQTIGEGLAAEAKAQADSLGIGSDISRAASGQLGPVIGQQLGVKLPPNR